MGGIKSKKAASAPLQKDQLVLALQIYFLSLFKPSFPFIRFGRENMYIRVLYMICS